MHRMASKSSKIGCTGYRRSFSHCWGWEGKKWGWRKKGGASICAL